jgi:hypothetical protein
MTTKLSLNNILTSKWTQELKQQIFDQTAEHLLTQSKKALLHGRCWYRSSDGCQCAIGPLISEETYESSMEGKSIEGIIKDFFFDKYNSTVINFLSKLQYIHDCRSVNYWQMDLNDFANNHDLKTDILKQFSWNQQEQKYVKQ